MITEAKEIKASYDYYTGKLKVIEKGKTRIFKDVPESECDKLINGLERNPGSGYLHFNKFLSKYFDKEIKPSEDWNEDYLEAYRRYKKEKDEEEWDKEIEKEYKKQQEE